MSVEILHVHAAPERAASQIRVRLEEVLSVFRAIDAGELLAALPECEVARAQHRTALRLLALAERELARLREDVDA